LNSRYHYCISILWTLELTCPHRMLILKAHRIFIQKWHRRISIITIQIDLFSLHLLFSRNEKNRPTCTFILSFAEWLITLVYSISRKKKIVYTAVSRTTTQSKNDLTVTFSQSSLSTYFFLIWYIHTYFMRIMSNFSVSCFG
jgi:hypothetical protein